MRTNRQARRRRPETAISEGGTRRLARIGAEQVLLDREAQAAHGLDHPRWGELVAVAAGAELYINGIGVVFEPVDVVITVNELSQGNLHAAIGFIPFISATVLKQGATLVVKNGDNVIAQMTKQVADAIGVALKKTNVQDQLRYLVENTSVAQRQVVLDARILVSARKRISPQQYLRELPKSGLPRDFIDEQIEVKQTFTRPELHHDLPYRP